MRVDKSISAKVLLFIEYFWNDKDDDIVILLTNCIHCAKSFLYLLCVTHWRPHRRRITDVETAASRDGPPPTLLEGM